MTVSARWSCYRKPGYQNAKHAASIAGRINDREGRAVVRVYTCVHCGSYHIGHAPGMPRKAQSSIALLAEQDALALLSRPASLVAVMVFAGPGSGAVDKYKRRTGFVEHRDVVNRRLHNGRLSKRAH